MQWLTKRIKTRRFTSEVVKQQHLVFLPSDSQWPLGNHLLREILLADGRSIIDIANLGQREEQRLFMKSVTNTPSWLLIRADSALFAAIAAMHVHPMIAAIAENCDKEQANRVIRGLHPQRVVLCADGAMFETQARLIQKGTTMITVGQGRAKYQIKALQPSASSIMFSLISPLGRQEVTIPSVDEQSVCEIAMAVAIANELGCTQNALMYALQHAWK